jgi:major membrane immunogen (membrane-anchored lipoprotein)
MERQMSSAKWVALTVLIAVMTLAVACGDSDDQGGSAGLPTSRGETDGNPVHPNVLLDITDVQQSQSLREIRDYADVVEATLLQSGVAVTLDLVVGSAISEERAKELGDQFIRVVKRRGPDHRPVNQLGTGSLDYTITVFHPGEVQIAKGTKKRIATQITWEQGPDSR